MYHLLLVWISILFHLFYIVVGDANTSERPGDGTSKCDGYGFPDGLSLHRLFSKAIYVFWNNIICILQSSLSAKAPFILLGVIGIISAIPGLFLPETADVNFPETIEDAEIFGK